MFILLSAISIILHSYLLSDFFSLQQSLRDGYSYEYANRPSVEVKDGPPTIIRLIIASIWCWLICGLGKGWPLSYSLLLLMEKKIHINFHIIVLYCFCESVALNRASTLTALVNSQSMRKKWLRNRTMLYGDYLSWKRFLPSITKRHIIWVT